jgi:hypothetical protein
MERKRKILGACLIAYKSYRPTVSRFAKLGNKEIKANEAKEKVINVKLEYTRILLRLFRTRIIYI